MRCHGTIGGGDGPAGGGSRDSRWQDARTEAQLGESIRSGRGSMPAFDLPQDTVRELVGLIRLMRSDRPRPDAAARNPQGAASAYGPDTADAAANADARVAP
jgi:mono/diheme cytochrome c family protein